MLSDAGSETNQPMTISLPKEPRDQEHPSFARGPAGTRSRPRLPKTNREHALMSEEQLRKEASQPDGEAPTAKRGDKDGLVRSSGTAARGRRPRRGMASAPGLDPQYARLRDAA